MVIGGDKVLAVGSIQNKIADCLNEFDELVILNPTDGGDKDLIEIDFEPINSNASGGSIQIYDVRKRRPWVTLNAGFGLKFEWYDGCDYPDICCFIRAIARGNVRETVLRWHEQYVGSTGYIEISGKRYESSYNVLGLHYFLGKLTKRIDESDMEYEPWDKNVGEGEGMPADC